MQGWTQPQQPSMPGSDPWHCPGNELYAQTQEWVPPTHCRVWPKPKWQRQLLPLPLSLARPGPRQVGNLETLLPLRIPPEWIGGTTRHPHKTNREDGRPGSVWFCSQNGVSRPKALWSLPLGADHTPRPVHPSMPGPDPQPLSYAADLWWYESWARASWG